VEFGETLSSSLTMEEFMTVDLEEEHDPPAFKAARVKDRDQLQKVCHLSSQMKSHYLTHPSLVFFSHTHLAFG